MSITSLEERFIWLIATTQDYTSTGNIKLDSRFRDDLGFDSLDELELLMAVEEEFEVFFEEDEVQSVRTVKDALQLLSSKFP